MPSVYNYKDGLPEPLEYPCIIHGLPFDKYLSIDAASSSALGVMLKKSPKHVKAGIDKPSKAKDLGTVFHCMLLTPDDFDSQVVIKPENANRQSNDNRRAYVEWATKVLGVPEPKAIGQTDKEMLDSKLAVLEPLLAKSDIIVTDTETVDIANKMCESVRSSDIGETIFSRGSAEVTVLAIDTWTGVLCKIRVDWIPDYFRVLVDLKSAMDAAKDSFARHCANYGYHRQAAFYQRIYGIATGQYREFVHSVCETSEPYDAPFYSLDAESLDAGMAQVSIGLEHWRDCIANNRWPGNGYDYALNEYTIAPLRLPRWAL